MSTPAQLRQALRDADRLDTDAFEVLAAIAELLADERTRDTGQELIVRALDRRDRMGAHTPILDALVRQSGLFPYLGSATLTARDAIAVETHRPEGLDGVVFHAVQAAAYRHLRDGEDVVLTAPTSFGKSLIVDALIASGDYATVLIIVPSIALIDETRARLQRRFGDTFSVVSHASQRRGPQTLMVMTQERALELTTGTAPPLDLLVIDEFYKLDPALDPERSTLLNLAFDRLRRHARQVFLLGPRVGGLPPKLPGGFAPRIIATDAQTVALDIERIDLPAAQRPARLGEICRNHPGPTLIYTRAPGSSRRVAQLLVEHGVSSPTPELADAAAWLEANISDEWTLPQMLTRGIGIHHAQMPRWLGQFMVRGFDAGLLPYLVCTSTLIEGVNTAAKNVIIWDNEFGRHTKLDAFTFNNIAGRSGRMWQHFVGRVFHFHPRPRGPLPDIDVPVLTQSEDAPTSLLLEVPPAEQTDLTRRRLQHALSQDLLSPQTLRANAGIPVDKQLALAHALDEDPEFFAVEFDWNGLPTKRQLRAACDLMWAHLVAVPGRKQGVGSGAALAARINRMRADPDMKGIIADELDRDYEQSADEAVESVLQFFRSWAQFEFPKLLRALGRIATDVLERDGLTVGDFGPFAAQVESLFMPSHLATLDEYGVPPQLGAVLVPAGATDLDNLLEQLKGLDVDQLRLTSFEKELVAAAQLRL